MPQHTTISDLKVLICETGKRVQISRRLFSSSLHKQKEASSRYSMRVSTRGGGMFAETSLHTHEQTASKHALPELFDQCCTLTAALHLVRLREQGAHILIIMNPICWAIPLANSQPLKLAIACRMDACYYQSTSTLSPKPVLRSWLRCAHPWIDVASRSGY